MTCLSVEWVDKSSNHSMVVKSLESTTWDWIPPISKKKRRKKTLFGQPKEKDCSFILLAGKWKHRQVIFLCREHPQLSRKTETQVFIRSSWCKGSKKTLIRTWISNLRYTNQIPPKKSLSSEFLWHSLKTCDERFCCHCSPTQVIFKIVSSIDSICFNLFQVLALKHHTSKIEDFPDLQSLTTFGFRGEALSSLCALGKLTVETRTKNEEVAAHLTFDPSGLLTSEKKTARQIGTSVTVEKLFSTLPVRSKEFSRNIRREYGKLISLMNVRYLSLLQLCYDNIVYVFVIIIYFTRNIFYATVCPFEHTLQYGG